MKIADVMTRDVQIVGPQDSVRRAAQLMDELNVGALPVCDGQRLVGMITDRDITVRVTAAGLAADTQVSQAMSEDIRWCREDASIKDVIETMKNVQIRRVPVIDDDKRLIGIVALGDLAVEDAKAAGKTLKTVSYPAEPDR